MTDAPGVLHPAAVGPGDRTGPALPIDGEWPDDDTCDNPAPCGEQAAVEALRCTWGEAYDIGAEEGLWWFRRKDGVGGTETAASPDLLLAQLVIDYGALPVRCPPLAHGPLTTVVAHRPGRRPHHPLPAGRWKSTL